MAKWFYLTLLVSAVGYVLAKGGRDERLMVLLLLFSSIATYVFFDHAGRSFLRPQPMLIVCELVVLTVMLTVAYRSDRFWPMFIAAFQMAVVLSLLTPAFGQHLVSYGLGVAQGLWAYLQLVVLAIVRERRRSQRVSATS